MKVKVISLPYIYQVLYALCFTRQRYQVSVYRTIGPLFLLLTLLMWFSMLLVFGDSFGHVSASICVSRLLAHLSRRLIGELIVYPWFVVRPSSVRRPQCSNIFFSETACPIKAKFYVEPPWVGETKFCSRHLDHVTKMAATPIYGKTLQKSSSQEPAGRFSRNLVCSIGNSSPS